MDFTIAASKEIPFLELELQKELGFATTTIELAVIDNVVLHGRFMLWRSILRDRLSKITKDFVRRVR
jgi:hypothetical protein